MGALQQISLAENTIKAASCPHEVSDYLTLRQSIAWLLGRDAAYDRQRQMYVDAGYLEHDFNHDTTYFLPSLYDAALSPELVLALRAVQVESARREARNFEAGLTDSQHKWRLAGEFAESQAGKLNDQFLNAHQDLSPADHRAISCEMMFSRITERFPALTAKRLRTILEPVCAPAPVLVPAP